MLPIILHENTNLFVFKESNSDEIKRNCIRDAMIYDDYVMKVRITDDGITEDFFLGLTCHDLRVIKEMKHDFYSYMRKTYRLVDSVFVNLDNSASKTSVTSMSKGNNFTLLTGTFLYCVELSACISIDRDIPVRIEEIYVLNKKLKGNSICISFTMLFLVITIFLIVVCVLE